MEYLIAILFGWLLGLLVNYLADALPMTRRISAPKCLRCNAVISPLRYWSLLTCSACGRPRPIRTWIVQAIMVLCSVWFMLIPPVKIGGWLAFCIAAFFLLVAVIDVEYRVVLIQTAVAGIFFGLPVGIYLHGFTRTLLGGATGFLAMLGFYFLGILFGKILTKLGKNEKQEEALGFGDVYLCAVLGLFLGWPGILAGIALGTLTFAFSGGLYLLYLVIMRRYQYATALPMAPFLILGSVVLLFRTSLGF